MNRMFLFLLSLMSMLSVYSVGNDILVDEGSMEYSIFSEIIYDDHLYSTSDSDVVLNDELSRTSRRLYDHESLALIDEREELNYGLYSWIDTLQHNHQSDDYSVYPKQAIGYGKLYLFYLF